MLIEEFKAAAGKYPTGITIVSAKYNNNFYGFTSNSFSSVSLEPTLVSFCLSTKANSFDAFINTKNFAINILASNQKDLAIHFASPIANKFQNINFIENKFGTPIINNSLSSIECENYQQINCGDHYIFIGKVFKVQINSDLKNKSPLIYYGKSYTELK